MAYNNETGMYEGYIYKIYNDVNDKLYIGQTYNTIAARFSAHKSASKNDKYGSQAVYRAMKKYGLKHFNVCEIEKIICNSIDELIKKLNEKEIYWIEFYDSYNSGYNSTKGGNNVAFNNTVRVDQYSLSGLLLNTYNSIKEASEITGVHDKSIAMCINKHNKTGGGYVWAKHGENPSFNIRPTYSKYIKQYSKDGVLINVYDSVTDAANKAQIRQSGISQVLNKNTNTYKGYYWFDENHEFSLPKPRYKKIKQYNSFGELINTYSTAKDAQVITGIDANSILLNCHGKQLSAGYYIWRFEEDEFAKYDTPSKMWPVVALDDNGNEIYRFHYIREACEILNIDNTNIYQSINMHVKCRGYYWAYIKDLG